MAVQSAWEPCCLSTPQLRPPEHSPTRHTCLGHCVQHLITSSYVPGAFSYSGPCAPSSTQPPPPHSQQRELRWVGRDAVQLIRACSRCVSAAASRRRHALITPQSDPPHFSTTCLQKVLLLDSVRAARRRLLVLTLLAAAMLAAMLVVAHHSGGSAASSAPRYVLVIDAGSSGTRMYAYTWRSGIGADGTPRLAVVPSTVAPHKVPRRALPGKRAYQRVETEPGLDRFADDPDGLRRKALGERGWLAWLLWGWAGAVTCASAEAL